MQSNPLLQFNESFKTLPTADTNNDNALLNTLSSRQILTYATIFLIGYPILVSLLRFRRLQSLKERYNFPTRESLARMTDDQAWEIQKELAQLEFPFIYIKSLQFALFRVGPPLPVFGLKHMLIMINAKKTYGIPTISSVLTGTTQFSNPETALKRYSDTSALVQEMVGHAPSSNRAYTSIARTRFLHSPYRSSGKILDDDMLYTLGLFALQPVRFINWFEWRQLTDLERCAIGTFWKSIGDGLGISYEVLPSGKTGGFRDGIHWLEEIGDWSDAYEKRCMVPHIKNRETADQTTSVLVYMIPKPLQHIGLKFVSFMMDDRLRKAMLYDAPPASYSTFFSTLLTTRRLFLRYLSLPRPYFLRHMSISENPDQNDRIFFRQWDAAPYYVKPTFWARWGPTAWLTWALGRPLPGDDGDKYYPNGYAIPDVGPKYFEGKGKQALQDTVEELKTYRTGRCPFH